MVRGCELIVIIGAIIALFVITFFSGFLCGSMEGERTGYCQALADIESGKKPLYELKKQEDGTTKWEVVEK